VSQARDGGRVQRLSFPVELGNFAAAKLENNAFGACNGLCYLGKAVDLLL